MEVRLRVAERGRLAQADSGEQPWRAWGPYLAERAWGTVREDDSEHGTAWSGCPVSAGTAAPILTLHRRDR
jgi:hypothetical protein